MLVAAMALVASVMFTIPTAYAAAQNAACKAHSSSNFNAGSKSGKNNSAGTTGAYAAPQQSLSPEYPVAPTGSSAESDAAKLAYPAAKDETAKGSATTDVVATNPVDTNQSTPAYSGKTAKPSETPTGTYGTEAAGQETPAPVNAPATYDQQSKPQAYPQPTPQIVQPTPQTPAKSTPTVDQPQQYAGSTGNTATLPTVSKTPTANYNKVQKQPVTDYAPAPTEQSQPAGEPNTSGSNYPQEANVYKPGTSVANDTTDVAKVNTTGKTGAPTYLPPRPAATGSKPACTPTGPPKVDNAYPVSTQVGTEKAPVPPAYGTGDVAGATTKVNAPAPERPYVETAPAAQDKTYGEHPAPPAPVVTPPKQTVVVKTPPHPYVEPVPAPAAPKQTVVVKTPPPPAPTPPPYVEPSKPAPAPVEVETGKQIVTENRPEVIQATIPAQTTTVIVTASTTIADEPDVTIEKVCKAQNSGWKMKWRQTGHDERDLHIWLSDGGRGELTKSAATNGKAVAAFGSIIHVKGGGSGEQDFNFAGVAKFGNIIVVDVSTDLEAKHLLKEARMKNDCHEDPTVVLGSVCKSDNGKGLVLTFSNKSTSTEKFTVLRDGKEVNGSPFEMQAGTDDVRKFLPIDADAAKITIHNDRTFHGEKDVTLDCNQKPVVIVVQEQPTKVKEVKATQTEVEAVQTVQTEAAAVVTQPKNDNSIAATLAATGLGFAKFMFVAMLLLGFGCTALYMRRQSKISR